MGAERFEVLPLRIEPDARPAPEIAVRDHEADTFARARRPDHENVGRIVRGEERTIELAKQMIDKFVKNTAREISIDFIQKIVCDYFGIPVDSINSKTRKRDIVQARQLAMYFSKKHTKSSLAAIGLVCGNKDHATVLHACRTVNNLIETDKQFRLYVEEIEKRIKF